MTGKHYFFAFAIIFLAVLAALAVAGIYAKSALSQSTTGLASTLGPVGKFLFPAQS